MRKVVLSRNLSKNFTLAEFTKTSHTDLQAQNIPTGEQVFAMEELCRLILQPYRDFIKLPIIISSGFRNPTLNARVGGVPNSDHVNGTAVDMYISSLPIKALAKSMYDFIKNNNINVTQFIFEPGWIHVSYDPKKIKNEFLFAYRDAVTNKMKYRLLVQSDMN